MKATNKAKKLGLKLDTRPSTLYGPSLNPAVIHSVRKGQDVGDFTEIATAPPHQHKFESPRDKPSATKESEALLNPDWRSNRRPGGFLGDPTTAGPQETEFQKVGGHPVKQRPQEDPVAQHSVRRYRTSPVDPDFIHSAPLTKKDHDDISDIPVPSDERKSRKSRDSSSMSNLLESIVKLGSLPPDVATQVGDKLDWRSFDLVRQKGESGMDKAQPHDNASVGAMNCEPSDLNVEQETMFPFASVKSIKNSKRFQTQAWNDVDQEFKKAVTRLDMPQTASLPPDYMRRNYETQQFQFNNFLNKLTKSSGNRVDIDYDINGESPSRWAKKPKASKQQSKTPSPAKANHIESSEEPDDNSTGRTTSDDVFSLGTLRQGLIDGVRAMHQAEEFVAQRNSSDSDAGNSLVKNTIASTTQKKQNGRLNPLASEFQSTNQVTNSQEVIKNSPSPETMYLSDSSQVDSQATNNQPVTAEDMRLLYAFLADIKNDIATIKRSESRDTSASQSHHLTQQLNTAEDMASKITSNPGFDNQSQGGQDPSGLLPESAALQGAQQNGGYFPSQHQFVPQSHTPIMHGGSTPNRSVSVPHYNESIHNGPSAPFHQQLGLATLQAPHLPQPQALPYVLPQVPPPGPAGFAGPMNPGLLPLHTQAQMLYGPKPVRKPKGPAYMGDSRFINQQQQYEQYLEIRRSTDPEYARQCKERQNKRAARQGHPYQGPPKGPKGPTGRFQGPQAYA
ncbi:hypothetical protein M426DRAFT_7297 [Hypoxylon sp. CI-4A]|nr:hypothetical protein M426DRAFT_7297 [Hypoxylon sp. CI-4A]